MIGQEGRQAHNLSSLSIDGISSAIAVIYAQDHDHPSIMPALTTYAL